MSSGSPDPAERDGGGQPVELIADVEDLEERLGGDRAGRHRVDPDARRQLQRQRLGEVVHPSLGGGVRAGERRAAGAGTGGDVHDRAAGSVIRFAAALHPWNAVVRLSSSCERNTSSGVSMSASVVLSSDPPTLFTHTSSRPKVVDRSVGDRLGQIAHVAVDDQRPAPEGFDGSPPSARDRARRRALIDDVAAARRRARPRSPGRCPARPPVTTATRSSIRIGQEWSSCSPRCRHRRVDGSKSSAARGASAS